MVQPDLQQVRDELEQRNCPVMLESCVKIFVWPDQYERVREAIEYFQLHGFQFRARHVVVAASLCGLVDTAINAHCHVKSERVTLKCEVLLPIPAAPAE